MMGRIEIKELRIPCIIGVYSHERTSEQELIVDLSLELPMGASTVSDHLDDTLDYDQVAGALTEVAQVGQYQLIEAYAYAALQRVFQDFPVERAEITVKKPGAIAAAKWASVQLSLKREDMAA